MTVMAPPLVPRSASPPRVAAGRYSKRPQIPDYAFLHVTRQGMTSPRYQRAQPPTCITDQDTP